MDDRRIRKLSDHGCQSPEEIRATFALLQDLLKDAHPEYRDVVLGQIKNRTYFELLQLIGEMTASIGRPGVDPVGAEEPGADRPAVDRPADPPAPPAVSPVAEAILRFVSGVDSEAVLGDLQEQFLERALRDGPDRAHAWYRRQVRRSLGAFVWRWIQRIALIESLLSRLG
ncbi:MAG: hypothetical protein QOG72_427 [Sphingomonadales bacterium]|jgi:hypothetical protein|nr:hypothetical protein [Sphingomonadales bacterium]